MARDVVGSGNNRGTIVVQGARIVQERWVEGRVGRHMYQLDLSCRSWRWATAGYTKGRKSRRYGKGFDM